MQGSEGKWTVAVVCYNMWEYVYRIQSLHTFSGIVYAAATTAASAAAETATATATQYNLKMLPCCLLQQIIEKHYKCWLGRLFKRYRLQYNSVPMFPNSTFPYTCTTWRSSSIRTRHISRQKLLVAWSRSCSCIHIHTNAFELLVKSCSLSLFLAPFARTQYNQPHAQNISWKNE